MEQKANARSKANFVPTAAHGGNFALQVRRSTVRFTTEIARPAALGDGRRMPQALACHDGMYWVRLERAQSVAAIAASGGAALASLRPLAMSTRLAATPAPACLRFHPKQWRTRQPRLRATGPRWSSHTLTNAKTLVDLTYGLAIHTMSTGTRFTIQCDN